jgi:hypothetical protein
VVCKTISIFYGNGPAFSASSKASNQAFDDTHKDKPRRASGGMAGLQTGFQQYHHTLGRPSPIDFEGCEDPCSASSLRHAWCLTNSPDFQQSSSSPAPETSN